MSHHDPTNAPASAEEAGLSPTPTTGLSEDAATGKSLYSGLNDPNTSAMNENADAAEQRQNIGDAPGSESKRNPAGLPSTQSAEFEDGT